LPPNVTDGDITPSDLKPPWSRIQSRFRIFQTHGEVCKRRVQIIQQYSLSTLPSCDSKAHHHWHQQVMAILSAKFGSTACSTAPLRKRTRRPARGAMSNTAAVPTSSVCLCILACSLQAGGNRHQLMCWCSLGMTPLL
jgi:hypothetical protein